jgi:hypothetical protein
MKHLAFIAAVLLVAVPVMAQDADPLPEVAGTNTVPEAADTNAITAIADTNLVTETIETNDVVDVADTNAVETAGTTNRIEQADAELMGLRDPFWPVGYEPAPPQPELTEEEAEQAKIEEEVEKKIQWPALQLKGITRAGKDRYMAIVKGVGLVEAGQTVSMRRGDLLYSWLIEEVTADGVEFTRLEARPYRQSTIGVRTQ